MFSIEFLSAFTGLILTLLVFSYLIGDNPLFRLAIYLFIGVASGYGATVVWHYVLIPKLFAPIQSGDPNQLLLVIIPLILCVSLLTKLSPRISWMGNFAMAILVGVGAATAVGGAVLGTLIPQVQAAIDALDFRSAGGGAAAFASLLEGMVMLAGTVFTLGYFQFTARRAPDGTPKRNAAFEAVAWAGRIFIAVTFGVLFAGVYMAALTAMIERLSSIINFIRQLIGF
ncbi:MAG TPA: hypothetical protein VMJ90_03810 [Anaerolineales bacterium]|nr:hypothetical protein [Anaerolineales bacterium]